MTTIRCNYKTLHRSHQALGTIRQLLRSYQKRIWLVHFASSVGRRKSAVKHELLLVLGDASRLLEVRSVLRIQVSHKYLRI